MAAASPAKPKPPARDAVRELFETLAFVVVLVLMLKLFVVEAFVIPTGSMAETLLGYNKVVTCPECGFEFPVNASNEVDPWDGVKRPVTGACCPNCRHVYVWVDRDGRPLPSAPTNRSGDRVLVHKALYEFGKPTRGDVVVFKFPVDPQVNHTAQNYIKRLWGLSGETLAIHNGDLYRTTSLDYPETEMMEAVGDDGNRVLVPRYPRPSDPLNQWEGPQAAEHSKTDPKYRDGHSGPDYTYNNTEVALKLFADSRKAGFTGAADKGFTLVRKTDAQALAMRRIVYDNDHQPSLLIRKNVPPRWSADGGGWEPNDPKTYSKTFTHSGNGPTWLRYRHRVPGPPTPVGPGQFADDWQLLQGGVDYREGMFPPSPITNFLGYNAGIEAGGSRTTGDYWVGDLMLECTAEVSGPADEVVLELSKGASRFRARFADGKVTVSRVGPGGRDLATRPTRITSAGKYGLRFANFDCRLRVWVDGTAIDFGTDADYSPAEDDGYAAAVGAVAGGAFGPFTPSEARSAAMPAGPGGFTLANDILAPAGVGASGAVTVSKLVVWEDTFFTPADNHPYPDPDNKVDTFYVQPGHYFCLGDNSGQSSDSRKWGLVPERLMLGKAVFVFFPIPRIGFIR